MPLPNFAWAKYNNNDHFHSLLCHSADVAACFKNMIAQIVWKARLNQAAGMVLSDKQIERLLVLVYLHDIGKLSPCFQIKALSEDEKQHLGSAACISDSGHPNAGAELLLGRRPGGIINEIRCVLPLEEIEQWADRETINDLFLVSFSHHGRPVAPDLTNAQAILSRWQPLSEYNPKSEAEKIGKMLPKWFPLAFEEGGELLPDNAEFQHFLAGIVSLADWIGSDTRYFRFENANFEGVNAFAYWEEANQRAKHALKSISLDVADQRNAFPADITFEKITTFLKPKPQQARMADISVEEQLVILEAETGSGKTEAALWRFVKLFEAGKVDGLYFAVPTRAAAKQLQRRVHEVGKRIFGDECPETVLAAGGYLFAGEHDGQKLPDWEVLWDDALPGKNETRQIAKRWAAENTKRFLAAQFAVGTIDQAMLGFLPVKHAHLRASSMGRNLLVIDEIHASDTYMTKIQQQLVQDHLQIGGYVLGMSATLGAVARVKWLAAAKKSRVRTH